MDFPALEKEILQFWKETRAFEKLEPTGITRLQEILIDQRTSFLADPVGGNAQSIGAFASLHVSIFVTAALAAPTR